MAQFERERTAWCRRFDDAERGVYTPFHLRWIWRVVEDLSRRAHPDGHTGLDNYFARTAIDSLALGVGREVDRDAATSSIVQVLERLVREPRMANRERYVEGVKQSASDDVRDASQPLATQIRHHADFRELDLHPAYAMFAIWVAHLCIAGGTGRNQWRLLSR